MSNDFIDKLKKSIKGKICVFIDAANLEQSVRGMWVNPKDIPDELKKYTPDQLVWRIDYEKLKKFFEGVGNLGGIRFYSAYFASDSHGRFLAFLKKVLAFVLKTKPLKEYGDHTQERPHRKANFDVEIAVDATFSLKDYDTLILFSGDWSANF